MGRRSPLIAVCGAGEASVEIQAMAECVGKALAQRGAIVLSGGLGGVMEACCRGAKAANGTTVGILPGITTERANEYVDIPIATGMSHGRNAIIVHTADAILALPGSYGTLSEIALALAMEKPVIAFGDVWEIPGSVQAHSLDDAVAKALAAAAGRETLEHSG